MTETTSLSLLQRIAANGEETDWSRLVLIYSPFILSRVRSYPDLVQHAEDISQEVMMVLMRELPTFERQQTGSFRNFLRKITVNQLRSAARKHRRHRNASPCELEQKIEELADPTSIASTKWNEEHDLVVRQKILDLVKEDFEPQTWVAFERHALKQESAKSVAATLGMTANAVMLAKTRVLRRMRQEASGLVDN